MQSHRSSSQNTAMSLRIFGVAHEVTLRIASLPALSVNIIRRAVSIAPGEDVKSCLGLAGMGARI